MRRTVPPSAEIEEQIDRLLAVGVGEHPRESLSDLAKLGARLIIQRAVEDEFDAWLGRARYERRPEAPPGLRHGFRPRRVQTAEGELAVEIPQVRQAAEPFVSRLFPRGTKLLRTEPLRDGDRRIHARAVDARRRVAVRAGRARQSCRSRPPPGSAPICVSASRRSGAATSTTSTSRRCSWTPPFSLSAATDPRRVCWSPGGSPKTANASFWR
ncbi:MAG TPA: transposase [Solirubrobacteraceae bacterium]|nr:transposase [Solirubrobacteraceae bacterium]